MNSNDQLLIVTRFVLLFGEKEGIHDFLSSSSPLHHPMYSGEPIPLWNKQNGRPNYNLINLIMMPSSFNQAYNDSIIN